MKVIPLVTPYLNKEDTRKLKHYLLFILNYLSSLMKSMLKAAGCLIHEKLKSKNLFDHSFLTIMLFFGSFFLSLLILTFSGIWKLFRGSVSVDILAGILFVVFFLYILFALTLNLGHPKLRKVLGYVSALVLILFISLKLEGSQFVLLLGASLLIPFCVFFFSLKEDEKYPLWLIGTLVIMIMILSMGLLGLESTYPNPSLSLRLNIEGDILDRYDDLLNCLNKNPNLVRIKTGDSLLCKIGDGIKVLNYSLTLKSKNNSFIYVGKEVSEILIPLPETETQDIYFEANLSHKDGRESLFVTTYYDDYEVLNENSWKKKDREFLKSLYLLVTAVFFSIPLMMVNLRKLSKIERKRINPVNS